MEKFIVATEKSWWIIIALGVVFVLFTVFVEIFRQKDFKGKYLKFIPVSFMVGCGIVSLIFSLMLVWWLALPLCVGMVCLARMHEKLRLCSISEKRVKLLKNTNLTSQIYSQCVRVRLCLIW